MKVNKSFKYDSEKCPKVHEWVKRQNNFSESVRRLIEKECSGENPVLEELRQLRQQIAGLRLSGPVTPQQEAELIQIEVSAQRIEEKTGFKGVDRSQLKNRYNL